MKIAVFTSTRADSGILSPIIRAFGSREEAEVYGIISGTHLSQDYGESVVDEIHDWPLKGIYKVPFQIQNKSGADLARSLGDFQGDVATVLERLKPEIALVLGDRTETLAFSFVCSLLDIPLVHLHGGDITFGARDELHRHAISKLSQLHFPNSQGSAARLVQMGEDPSRVHYFGSFVGGRLANDHPEVRKEFWRKYPALSESRYFLISIHGALYDSPPTVRYFHELIRALDNFKDYKLVMTGPNSDIESNEVRKEIQRYTSLNPERAIYVESFGSQDYLLALEHAALAIGNSSSFVTEAPATSTPVILLGRRQEGRFDASTVHVTSADAIQIEAQVRMLLEQARASRTESPIGNVGSLIVTKILESPILRGKPVFFSADDDSWRSN